jgi:hypothetical protein
VVLLLRWAWCARPLSQMAVSDGYEGRYLARLTLGKARGKTDCLEVPVEAITQNDDIWRSAQSDIGTVDRAREACC